MKVKDFIKKLESCGYNDNTEITFGLYSYGGEWYDFDIEKFDYDGSYIDVIFELNEKYQKAVFEETCHDLVHDIKEVLVAYC